jgi:hypothetical protein
MPDRSTTIVTMVEQARGDITREMLEAAKEAKVSIETTQIAHASGPMGMVTNAGIAGTENITAEQLKQGADLMFVHVGGTRLRAPAGFYIVRVTADLATKQGKSSFIDRTGKSVAKLPVTIKPVAPGVTPRALRIRLSAGVDPVLETVYVDIEIGGFSISILIIEDED